MEGVVSGIVADQPQRSEGIARKGETILLEVSSSRKEPTLTNDDRPKRLI